jgi:hypothetical protein
VSITRVDDATARFHILPLIVLAFLVGRGALWLATWLARAAWAQDFALYVLLALAFALRDHAGHRAEPAGQPAGRDPGPRHPRQRAARTACCS